MKSTLLNELMKIPQDATYVTVLGVEMQVIDRDEAVRLLNFDPNDSNIHECILSNGHFLFQTENRTLVALYKVL